jgi:hypothetical protein
VLKVPSVIVLCGLRVSVEMNIAPKSPLQCKRCQCIDHTQRYCGYERRYVAGGETRHSGSAVPQSSNLSATGDIVKWMETQTALAKQRSGATSRSAASEFCGALRVVEEPGT